MNKPSLARASIKRLLQERWPAISNFRPLAEGQESQAFSFRSGGSPYVLRINVSSTGFEKDALAHRRFDRPMLPIPRVIEIGRLDDSHAYCISDRVSGRTLQETNSADLPALLEPTAKVLEAIGAANLQGFSGFGPFDKNGNGPYSSWNAFLLDVNERCCDERKTLARYLSLDQVGPVLARFNELVDGCPEQWLLVHGDFGSNNILARDGSITGVIDWSEALLGDPLYDVANILFWRTWLNCMEQQAAYFESLIANDPGVKRRLICYQLRIGLLETLESAQACNEETCRWAFARCETLAH